MAASTVTRRIEVKGAFVALAVFAGAAPLGCGAGQSAASSETLANAALPAAAKPPPLGAHVTVHVAGDSTAAIFPPTDATARVGWAAVLQSFFGEGVEVDDAARSGRSSKSYIDEGAWDALKQRIKPGDYVFIQFGHNDEKDDPARHTDPGTSFREHLQIYIRDARLAGAFPLLLTPISRREFSGTAIVATHGAYPAAIAEVGRQTGTPVIDMTEKTRALLERLGPAATLPLFASGDKTHLSAQGAPQVAALVAQGIRELQLPLAERLVVPGAPR